MPKKWDLMIVFSVLFLLYCNKFKLCYKEMLNEGLICHASGDFSHPFIDGFYLYYFPMCESPSDQSKYCFHLLIIFISFN